MPHHITTKIATLTAVLALLALAACQPDGKPANGTEKMFADYFVRYLADTREVKAQASFFLGETISDAQPQAWPGGVAFQDQDMTMRNLQDKMFRYQFTKEGLDFPTNATFRHTDDTGRPQTHTVGMTPIGPFSLPKGISLNRGLTLQVEGGRLQADESIVLLFSDADNVATSINIYGPSATEEHFIPGPNLANLRPGPGQLYLVKKKQTRETKNGLERRTLVEYYSRAIAVEVKD